MIIGQRDRIKELRVLGKNTDDSSTKRSITKQIGGIIYQGIKELKRNVDEDNVYHRYIKENKEMISEKYSFNVVVEDHDEAVGLLKTLDIRKILNIDNELNVPFNSKLFLKIEELDGESFNTKEEVNESLRAMELDNKKIITYDIRQTMFLKWTYNATYSAGSKKVYVNVINGQYKLFFKRNAGVDRGVEEENFDIINLYEIIMMSENTYQAINQLCSLFNIKIKYCIEQIEKYDFNIDRIYNKKKFKTNYPILNKFIEEHLYILLFFLENGKSNTNSSRNTVNGEGVFFCSGSYAEQELEKKYEQRLIVKAIKQNQICKIVNTFCALGLLVKLKKIEVPGNMYRSIKGIKGSNYFIVTRYTDEVFIKAEERAYRLSHGTNRISATSITEKKCQQLLGEEIAKAVYLNDGHKKDIVENGGEDLEGVS